MKTGNTLAILAAAAFLGARPAAGRLVAYWPFDEPSGLSFADALGSYHGAIVSPASLGATGRFSRAAQFTADVKPGSTARIPSALIADNGLGGAGARTFSMWFNTPSWNPTEDPGVQLVSYGAGGGLPLEAFMICLEGTGGQNRIALEAYGWPTPGGALWGTTETTGGTSRWNHIVIAYGGNTNFGATRVYVNGVSLGAPVKLGNDGPLNTSIRPLGIGGHEDGGWTNFSGALDDLGIWNEPLDEARIKALYHLAAHPGLDYSLGDVRPLFDLYDAGLGRADVKGRSWYYTATDATGAPGEVSEDGARFSVRLGERGSGVIGVPQVPRGLRLIIR